MLRCLEAKTSFYDRRETILSEGDPARYAGIVLLSVEIGKLCKQGIIESNRKQFRILKKFQEAANYDIYQKY